MVDIATLEWIVGVGVSLWGIAWGAFRFVDGKIAAVRVEAVGKIDALRAETAGDIDTLRAECAKRDDIQRIEAALLAITGRIDQVLTMMAQGRAA